MDGREFVQYLQKNGGSSVLLWIPVHACFQVTGEESNGGEKDGGGGWAGQGWESAVGM